MFNLLRPVGAVLFIAFSCAPLLGFDWSEPKVDAPPQKETVASGPKEQFAFAIVNVLDFGRRHVRSLAFCPTTRQLFVSHLDQDDDRLYQWDLDSKALLHTYRLGTGFICDQIAVSPAGDHLLVGCWPSKGHECKTLLIDTRQRRIVRDLARPGMLIEARFDSNGTTYWMKTSDASKKGVVLGLDGTEEKTFSMEHFPSPQSPNVWIHVPETKTPLRGLESKLFCKGSNGVVHLLKKNPELQNYGITSDGKIVVATTGNAGIVAWAADTGAEVFWTGIANRGNGGGYLAYDPKLNRFLIGDCSSQGTTWLRALTITRPEGAPGTNHPIATSTTEAGDSLRFKTRDADRSQVSKTKQGGDAAVADITHRGKASRPLDFMVPIYAKQAACNADLTITWYGDPPEEAWVYVGSVFVGRGRAGFTAAAKAVGALPKRGLLLMSCKDRPRFISDSRDTSEPPEIPDPFSVWPELDAVFAKLVSEKTIWVQASYGLAIEDRRRLELTPPLDDRQATRKPDLTITWHGNLPANARVFVGSVFVGRGQEGFAAAVKAMGALPRRGKLMMSYKPSAIYPPFGSSSEPFDPFVGWPDLDDAFSKLVFEKEICVEADKGADIDKERDRDPKGAF